MRNYHFIPKEEAEKIYNESLERYNEFKVMNLSLDMSRGKPSSEQISISNEMLSILKASEDCKAENGQDCRNYGMLQGIPEARKLYADILNVPTDNVIIGGNSSLNLMYDVIAKAFTHGFPDSPCKWGRLEDVKFLCPVPGYDRHFGICETFNIEMIPVPIDANGPHMDIVEQLVSRDKSIKGIWCVPKYSNPEGKVYSDEVVKRFAALKPAAPDFKIFWDNAYCVHDIYDDGPPLLNLYDECLKCGSEDMAFIFASTSKITFPGSGISCVASSKKNIDYLTSLFFYETISYDKLNQLRHVKYFKDKQGVLNHMKKHAAILKPKFDLVLETLERELEGTGCGTWIEPKGGYFISFDADKGCARRIVKLAKEAGVVLTTAGATFPHGIDPYDSNIRIAPTYPPLDELKIAIELFCICAKLATLERILKK